MFTAALPASEVEPLLAAAHTEETVLVQGVIDCLFQDAGGMVLVDYKTDRLQNEDPAALADRHRKQLQLYAQAVQAVYGQPATEAYVVYLRHSHVERIL
jgi:ATP-dependent helicase/nuclease subunit A